MKIKHILLSLVIAMPTACGKHYHNSHEQQSSQSTTQVTADDILGMFRFFKGTYFPVIEELRGDSQISRNKIIRAYKKDLFLSRLHDGGHASFKHKILPLSVGVVAHDSDEVESSAERTQHHKSLQVYVNVIKIFLQPFINIGKAVEEMNQMALKEWKQKYSKNLSAATDAFNATTKAEWASLIATEEAAFEEYSREEEKHILKKKKKK